MLQQDGFTIPKEVLNDCDPGDKAYITNATALQGEYWCISYLADSNPLRS